MPRYNRALCWIRRDLRLLDHSAISLATELGSEVGVVFVFDTQILGSLRDPADRRVTFIRKSLEELDQKLRAHGSRLIVLHGDPAASVPRLAEQWDADCVVTARDYEPYAVSRDRLVADRCSERGIHFQTVKDSVIMERGEVLSQQGSPLRVYSPYARAWQKVFQPARDAAEREVNLGSLSRSVPESDPWEWEDLGFQPSELWLEPGEDAGRERLHRFTSAIDRYGEDRDFPAIEGTSGLSVHLRFGTISIREAVRLARQRSTPGTQKWLAELIWRDFYQDILANNPRVVTEPFQAIYQGITYPGRQEWFQAWCEGRTGYPLIDAAMRCLNRTGFMHNRLRMVVASFLTKDLLIDYRQGEAYFAEKLLDFDLASNNGGWQWAASTGCDPQPYFRIFNPTSQSEKFDPEGEFIRRWVPELKGLEGPAIHFPAAASAFDLAAAGIELGRDYPRPIVDHKEMREQAIQLLASARPPKA